MIGSLSRSSIDANLLLYALGPQASMSVELNEALFTQRPELEQRWTNVLKTATQFGSANKDSELMLSLRDI